MIREPDRLTPMVWARFRFFVVGALLSPDGTTAAEQFYGTAPQDFFGWLLDRLPVPARPRCRRPAA